MVSLYLWKIPPKVLLLWFGEIHINEFRQTDRTLELYFEQEALIQERLRLHESLSI